MTGNESRLELEVSKNCESLTIILSSSVLHKKTVVCPLHRLEILACHQFEKIQLNAIFGCKTTFDTRLGRFYFSLESPEGLRCAELGCFVRMGSVFEAENVAR